MPRHVSPTSPDRTATAPYNFVPLPARVFEVADGIEVGGEKIKPWEMHDRFVPGTHSGSIELTIETLTPLFIRGAVGQRQDGAWDDRDSRRRPDPYTTPDGRPAIPGSSLRGMVRTLVEILSFSKIQPLTETKPFFRDISPSRISTEYRRHFIEDLGTLQSGIDIASGTSASRTAPCYRARVRAGYFRDTTRTIRECDLFRIEHALIQSTFNGSSVLTGSGPMATPNWSLQQRRIWVQADAADRDYFFYRKTTSNGRQRHPDLYLRFRKVNAASQTERSGYQSGLLVITGGIPNKHLEFVFLDPLEGAAAEFSVPDAIWDRFHDEDQITQWQEKAFPADRPTNGCRRAKGHLREGEPVFFLTDDHGDLVFLGRAQMFRFPYDMSPADLVPRELREGRLDLAEAMFGKVDESAAIKGRVQFEDAIATVGGPPWCEDAIVPRILSAPKPTTFQHYLTQDGMKGKDQLTTYIAGDDTTIRGHKLYWHRDDGSGLSRIKEGNNHDPLLQDLLRVSPQDTQHTVIRPVKAGVTFVGRVRFENLTDLELGALLHTLQLPDGCAHRLGMGKPLGLGSIRISARVRVVDRAARYRTWQTTGIAEDEDGSRFRDAFALAIGRHAEQPKETMLDQPHGIRRIARIDALFCLLEWANRPPPTATAYMDLNGFRKRPVLPTPHRVVGASEPSWPADPPEPASGGAGRDPRRGSSHRSGRQTAPRAAGSRQQERSATRPAQKPTAGVKAGDTVEAVLLEERTRKGGWRALHEPTGLAGHIHNSSDVPAEAKPGDRLALVVASVSAREIAFRFPTASTASRSEKKGKK
ncbi:MAG: TIGR03986 family CRISPR-associated RAMP protein [Thermoleophilia bacterium]|nr:TIGR03986 family CRISPR-associated RAMP protein [Thermoleophilia bacterium]